MNTPQFQYIPLLGHEIFVTTWGRTDNQAVVLWHGLARTGRDFDELAAALANDYFVICPDTIGRGLSSWASQPEDEYNVAHYADIAIALLDHFGIEKAKWLGTSMGGLIGMVIAASDKASRLESLILNDIGPEIPAAAVARILTYTDQRPTFNSISEAEQWLRGAYASFGLASEQYWIRMAYSSIRRMENGRYTLHYDSRIQSQFQQGAEVPHVWALYEAIDMPVHVIRGQQSDVLPEEVALRMQTCGPKAKTYTIDECGHAPSLSRPEDAQLIRSLLS